MKEDRKSHLEWLLNNNLESLRRTNEALAERYQIPARLRESSDLEKMIRENGYNNTPITARYEKIRLFLESL